MHTANTADVEAAVVAADAVVASGLGWMACKAGLTFRLYLDLAELRAGHRIVILHVPTSSPPEPAQLAQIKRAAPVIVAVFDGPPAIGELLYSSGINMIVSPRTSEHTLVFALREALAQHQCRLPVPHDAECPVERLSRRQREIAALIAAGMSNKAIARSLGISEGTTKVHLTAVYSRLGVKNRLQASILLNRAMAEACRT